MSATISGPLPFDTRVRLQIYEHLIRTGRAPWVDDLAAALSSDVAEVQAALRRLSDGRAIVLQASGELLMASPFSCVPTPFVVEAGEQSWWGNCIWDALGISAALHRDACILAACGCCNEAMALEVQDARLLPASGIIHFAVPAKDWWRNIVFT